MRRLLLTLVIVSLLLPSVAGAQPVEIDVKSDSAVLMDAVTGKMLFGKNESVRRPPASLTKIMTLVVAFDAIKSGRVKLSDKAMASEEAAKLGGTQVFAKAGEVFPLSEWILAVAVGSANDAAVVMAEHIAGTEKRFAQMMNEKARELGMTDTNFVNCHGLDDPDHYTTAKDLAILAHYAVTIPELLQLTGTYQAKFRNDTFGLNNVNKMVRFYTGCDGLKTGHTSIAKYCLVTTAKRGDQRFIGVVMGAENSDTRFADGRKLLDYGFANYASVMFAKKGDQIGQARVWGGTNEVTGVSPASDVGMTVHKGEESGLSQIVTIREDLKAPVKKGDAVGEVVVMAGKTELARIPLLAAADVPKASPLVTLMRVLREVGRMRW